MSVDVDSAPLPEKLPRGKRVLSGTQPTGYIHLGNYFGAIRQYIAFQRDNDAAYFIADYHSMTGIRDPQQRVDLTLHVARAFLALGLDPERSILYRQSDVPEVHELAWVLSSVTNMGLLERAHKYKASVASGQKPDHGLLAYPVLQAADILIHEADYVPVGQDQKQHIEMSRDMAVKFNLAYEELLKLPEAYILDSVAVVPGSDGRKMSKSYANTIMVFAPEKQLRKQVMGIVTDSTPVAEPKDPDLPVFELWNLFADPCECAAMRARCLEGGLGYGEAKKDLFERVLTYFAPARARYDALETGAVEAVLRAGAERARERAVALLARVRKACGLGPGKPG